MSGIGIVRKIRIGVGVNQNHDHLKVSNVSNGMVDLSNGINQPSLTEAEKTAATVRLQAAPPAMQPDPPGISRGSRETNRVTGPWNAMGKPAFFIGQSST